MKILAFLMVVGLSACAGEHPSEGMISIKKFEMISIRKFEITSPVSGTYAPWRDRNESWFAGELITISESTFRYRTFSDVSDSRRPPPDYSGKISVFKDHISLDHPGVPYPYRISGLADGVPVLFNWEGYERWKKDKLVFPGDLLFLEITPTRRK